MPLKTFVSSAGLREGDGARRRRGGTDREIWSARAEYKTIDRTNKHIEVTRLERRKELSCFWRKTTLSMVVSVEQELKTTNKKSAA